MRKYYSILFIFLLLLFLITGQSTPKDLDERAEEALEYCKENGYSTDYCLLVDYGRHSGRVRFFIWDFNKGKPILKSLCAHGYGKGSTARKPVFSNEPGSFCSSLGHYRVGKEKTIKFSDLVCQGGYNDESYYGYSSGYNDSLSAYNNSYYNDALDFDQQSEDFWESL